MDIMTDATRLARSRRSAKPNPAELWAPLAGLTDAAAQAASAAETVAITRGFDRNSRQRAKALRDLLNERGIATVEVTPAPGSSRLLAGVEVAALVNLIGSDSWQPYRLAAALQAPVLVPRADSGEPAEETRHDVITMTGESDKRDVALSHVAVRPEDPASSSVTITTGGEPLSVPGGNVTVGLSEQRLEIHVSGPDFAEQAFHSEQVRIETFNAPHRLVRDELPIAEFEGSVLLSAETAGLVVRPA